LDPVAISSVYIFAEVVRRRAVHFLEIGCRVPSMLIGLTCWEVACFTVTVGGFDSIKKLMNPGFKVASHPWMSRLLKDVFSGMSAPSTLNAKFVKKQWLACFPRRGSWWPRHLHLPGLMGPSSSVWE